MADAEWLAACFEEQRTQLRAVAYRMLGSMAEADDAVQNSWLPLSRADTSGVENLAGWLTTVVARECLNMLRARGFTVNSGLLTRRRSGAMIERCGFACWRAFPRQRLSGCWPWLDAARSHGARSSFIAMTRPIACT